MTVAIVYGGRAKLSRLKGSLGFFCLALGLDLHGIAEESRAMVRATRVDDVFDMPCPNQKTRDVLAISTLGWTNGAGGPYSMHSSPTLYDSARTSMTSWRGCLTKVL